MRPRGGRIIDMPKPYPEEFRRDVVAVARKGEIPLTQIAKDFGISQSCVKNWVKQADIDDGHRPGTAGDESDELREARKRIRQLEQEAEVMRRAVAYFSRDVNPK
jgi:transposase